MTKALTFLSAYRGIIRLALVALLLLGVLAFGAGALGRYFTVQEVSLPNLVGLSEAEAVDLLTELELRPVPFSESVPNAATGVVTSQSPLAGTIVREGRSISLGVNEPKASVSVPRLVGVTRDDSASQLEGLGLAVGEVRYSFNDAAEGLVLEQTPLPGTTLSPGESVDIVVSRGPDIPTITMPNVRGLTIDEAKRRLAGLGFTNIDTTATSISFDRPLSVTDQIPSSGEAVPPNARILLHYALSTSTVVQVPYLNGMSLGRAQNLLRASGLSLGSVSYITDPNQPGGVVSYEPASYTLSRAPVSLTLNSSGTPMDPPMGFSNQMGNLDFSFPGGANGPSIIPGPPGTQSPISGQLPGPGQPVTLPSEAQANNPEITTPVIVDGQRNVPFDFDPNKLGMANLINQAYTLKLKVVDERGERTVFEDVVSAGVPVHLDVTVYGDATLQTYVNDSLFLAWNP